MHAVSTETRRRLAAGITATGARLDGIEARLRGLERFAFGAEGLEARLDALEGRMWMPSAAELQEARTALIVAARREGMSITAISRRLRMSRSRVAGVIAASELELPERVTDVRGRSFPARAMAEHRWRGGNGAGP
jgi:hypothetical protein